MEEEKLIEQSKLLAMIRQTETDAIITSDESGVIRSWNIGAEKIFGYTEAEAIGKSLEIIIPDYFRRSHAEGIEKVNRGGAPKLVGKTVELSAVHKNETEFPIELTLGMWEFGNRKHYSAIIRDITERKTIEKELHEKNEKLKNEKEKLLEQTKRLFTISQTDTDAIITSDETGTIKSWNLGAEKIFGYTQDEILGRSIEVIIPEHLRMKHSRGMKRQNEGMPPKAIGKTLELSAVRKNGTEFPIELTLGKWINGSKRYYSGIIRDITRRKKNEAEINKKNDILNETNSILLKQKKEIETQAENLKLANAKISKQKEIIESRHKHTTDSILYAKRIQKAIIPTSSTISNIVPEHFILFKPRDVVSGDFYWIRKINQYLIIAVADCTGHGVPGAFMSVLGVSLLNELVGREEITSSDQLLNLLRAKIKISLNQTNKTNEAKDGMDIAVCVIDTDTNTLQYAGANNPLFIIRESNLPEADRKEIQAVKVSESSGFKLFHLKADRQPIGIYVKETPFRNNTLQLQKNDKLYMFSDGYVDQIGGKHQRKFMIKNFKELLLEIHSKPFIEQKEVLEQTINTWKNNTEQIDDILVVGIKI